MHGNSVLRPSPKSWTCSRKPGLQGRRPKHDVAAGRRNRCLGAAPTSCPHQRRTHQNARRLHLPALGCRLRPDAIAGPASRSDEEQTRLAGIGGLMHDLGKAAMPLEVLNKPGKLTDAEFAIMKRHPVEGAKMLRAGGAEPGWWTLPCTITRRSTEPATRIAWPVTPFHSWPAWAQSATSMMP